MDWQGFLYINKIYKGKDISELLIYFLWIIFYYQVLNYMIIIEDSGVCILLLVFCMCVINY